MVTINNAWWCPSMVSFNTTLIVSHMSNLPVVDFREDACIFIGTLGYYLERQCPLLELL